MPFKDNGRATLVGEPTFGSSGQPYFHKFDNTMLVRVSAKREYFPDGSEFEGVGIKPDVLIERRAEDVRSGKDAVFQKAIALSSQADSHATAPGERR